jgi:hypothetical protein
LRGKTKSDIAKPLIFFNLEEYMFLDFEKWINKKSIPQESLDTFLEAILCYKFGAYKASLLFSYIGFQLIIKDRILKSNMPQSFPTGKWAKIHR